MDIFSTHKMNKKTLPLEFVASSHHSEGRVHCTEKLKFGSKKKGGWGGISLIGRENHFVCGDGVIETRILLLVFFCLYSGSVCVCVCVCVCV